MRKKNVFTLIKTSAPNLRASEKKVADYILSSPEKMPSMRIVDLAAEVGVSEPTVVRFCQTVGFKGFQAFKIALAQSMAVSPIFSQFNVNSHDTVKTSAEKIFDSTISSLLNQRNNLDTAVLAETIQVLCKANKVEFYGYGTSAAIASDAQHKFLRLPFPCACYSDPHAQVMSASALGKGDVVIAISQSGTSRNLIHAAHIASNSGATVVSLCPGSTPLCKVSNICIEVDIIENFNMFATMTSRIVQLTVLDVLTVGVALRKKADIESVLQKINDNIRSLYT